jgi:hypothetical protein
VQLFTHRHLFEDSPELKSTPSAPSLLGNPSSSSFPRNGNEASSNVNAVNGGIEMSSVGKAGRGGAQDGWGGRGSGGGDIEVADFDDMIEAVGEDEGITDERRSLVSSELE